MSSGSDYRRILAAEQFHRARREAAVESLLARLSGQSADLLSYEQVARTLRVSGQSPGGLRQIPIKAIVGSVGRYQDFSRTFLPRQESDQDRWVTVSAAAPAIGDLPPIQVYKIGQNYFVLDGNHRVSIARRQGLDHIDAYVTEVQTRAPLPPDAQPDDLIIAAEYAAFLEATRLDLARPDVDMRVSVPGQYHHLEDHIAALRYRLGTETGRDVPFDEAAARWYDEVYLPVVMAIRAQGILRYFPGRTETDFYVWLARHRAEVERELGLDISPEVAVARLAPRVREAERAAAPRPSPLRRLTQLVAPDHSAPPPTDWAAERMVARYADRLFANVLAPLWLCPKAMGDEEIALNRAMAVLDRAVSISLMERAHLTVLAALPDDGGATTATVDRLRARLEEERVAHSLDAQLSTSAGPATPRVVQLAFLNDLLVLDRDYGRAAGEDAPSAAALAILAGARRPLLFIGPDAHTQPPRRALLVHDTRRKLDQAVFLAAYVAELWRVALVMLPIGNGRNTAGQMARVGDYLALHEVSAAYLEAARPSATLPDRIVAAATEADADLILLPSPGTGAGNERHPGLDDTINATLHRWPGAVMVAS